MAHCCSSHSIPCIALDCVLVSTRRWFVDGSWIDTNYLAQISKLATPFVFGKSFPTFRHFARDRVESFMQNMYSFSLGWIYSWLWILIRISNRHPRCRCLFANVGWSRVRDSVFAMRVQRLSLQILSLISNFNINAKKGFCGFSDVITYSISRRSGWKRNFFGCNVFKFKALWIVNSDRVVAV